MTDPVAKGVNKCYSFKEREKNKDEGERKGKEEK